jgi:hypothetical protein
MTPEQRARPNCTTAAARHPKTRDQRAGAHASRRTPQEAKATGRRFLRLFRREDALDLLKMIDVVPGRHSHDGFDALLAALAVIAVNLPLLRRE